MLVDGTITPVGGGIFLKDLPTGAVSLVAAGGSSPAFSPDGSKIAFVRVAPDLMSSDIFVADLMTGAVTFPSHATVGFSSTYQPLSFSPDGSKIAFDSDTRTWWPATPTPPRHLRQGPHHRRDHPRLRRCRRRAGQ